MSQPMKKSSYQEIAKSIEDKLEQFIREFAKAINHSLHDVDIPDGISDAELFKNLPPTPPSNSYQSPFTFESKFDYLKIPISSIPEPFSNGSDFVFPAPLGPLGPLNSSFFTNMECNCMPEVPPLGAVSLNQFEQTNPYDLS